MTSHPKYPQSPSTGSTAPFGVLVVCTANICRSPLAAALLRARIDDLGLPWTVTSAGTKARSATRSDPCVREVLGEVGIEHESTASRPLTSALVAGADLILTAETRNRHEVVSAHLSALRKTFTLRQFARLSSVVVLESTDSPGPDLIVGAGRARQRVQPDIHGADDIADPFGRDLAAFRQCRDTVDQALADMLQPISHATAEHAVDVRS